MDWRTLIRDRRVQLAGGAVAALALVVWWRRRATGSTSSTGSSSGGTGGAVGTTSAAGFDSTATDLAATLGNFQQAQQGQLNDFIAQLQAALRQAPPPSQPIPPGKHVVSIGRDVTMPLDSGDVTTTAPIRRS